MDPSLLARNPLSKKVRPYLGALKRAIRSLPIRTRRQKRLLLEDPTLGNAERELLKEVEPRISPGDGMYTGNGAHYFKVGLSAIECIEAVIDAAGPVSVGRVLDLPCGHGRVLRFLAQRFPNAKFTASDLDPKGVDFCARMFGAEPVYSQLDLSGLSLESQFDLIWCGSLITHLDTGGIRDLLGFFVRHLMPEGLLVFTSHGERMIEKMLNREFDYGIAHENIPSLIDSYQKRGFGFVNYPNASGYGVSLTTPEWIRVEATKLGLTEVYFREHGWDDHQDVYGFVNH